ncbi:NAD(P)-binding domain-containing protein [Oceanithermus sp.]|uniref:NAD(P)-binding domain-containing protein n=1 Tax=Oceanithermus sp. TaxID=2268145 RepID=UPI00257F71AA|nr:NAD(P)-binding domain-containing protein [Oceanithermus sp.]
MSFVDLVIVGAGPVGLAAALEAERLGLSGVVFEARRPAASIEGFPARMPFFSEGRKIEIGGHPMAVLGAKPLREEALVYYRRIAERLRLTLVHRTRVTGLEGELGAFRVLFEGPRGPGEVWSRAVAVATGYFFNPRRLGVPGEELPWVRHGYRDALEHWGERILVVGGSNSAVEAALDLWRAGARVTLVHRGPDVRPGVKYWLRPDFENRVREGAIRALFSTRVLRFEPGRALVAGPGGEAALEVDRAVVLIGYRADDALLRAAGARFADGKPVLTDRFETSVPGLFALGSAGYGEETRSVFIENGREHARSAVGEIARRLRGTGGATE